MLRKLNQLMSFLPGRSSSAPNNSRPYSPVSVTLPFSDEVILLILSHVPSEDLLNSCLWVDEWQEIINSNSLWLLKTKHEGKPVPAKKPDPLPYHFYRSIYFVPYGKNLLQNPCGEQALSFWESNQNTRTRQWDSIRFIAETPPVGTDPIPDTDVQSCFVSSYMWCEKEQSVNLQEAVGNYPQILDLLKPSIKVSENYAARFDCGGIYQLTVTLESASGEVLDSFEFEKEETVSLSVWQNVTHIFSDYPEGVQTLRFVHRAKDTQFWAGHYGMKLTAAEVSFVINN